jgi:hypothetical protein
MLKNDVHIVFQHARRRCDLRFASFFNGGTRLKNAGVSVHRAQAAERENLPAAC